MIHDLRHIKAFLAAARIGNFTRAAVEMHISQSAFTVQIRQLEDALGVRLFDRSKRRVVLTSAGRDLLAPLEQVIVEVESIVSRTRELSGLRRGIVRIAVLPSVAACFLPEALRRFTHEHPGIVVQIRDLVGARVLEAVRNDEVDFGIGSRIRADREVQIRPLLVDRLSAFVRKDHALARRQSVTLNEVAESPLIVTGRESSAREVLERSVKREKQPLNIAWETNYMTTALGLVRAGLGVAILPDSAVILENTAQIRRVVIARPALLRRIEIIQRNERTLSPAAMKLVEILNTISAQPAGSGKSSRRS
jgi:LysR family transcriptional regulator, carnitine catabolism transcriptional activator